MPVAVVRAAGVPYGKRDGRTAVRTDLAGLAIRQARQALRVRRRVGDGTVRQARKGVGAARWHDAVGGDTVRQARRDVGGGTARQVRRSVGGGAVRQVRKGVGGGAVR
ncbi:hypothetical protein [Streptomyces sp. NRRL B-24572]|uniref:hypothetical protein n=1 Tax=Streptomyces sp. NRRL B-24572 TaxID=1962156 RepID=UPI00117DA001|nr:hypothetical protein [Streptomyces sp. NRRL B-24572]